MEQTKLNTNTLERILNEKEHFNALAKEEEIFLGEKEFDFLDHPCIPEHESLRALIPGGLAGRTALDFGCGIGEAALCFAQRGALVSAVDVSDAAVERGRVEATNRGLSIDWQIVSDSKLPFADNSFDLIYGNGILHHVDLKQSLSELRRVLKPTGSAFFIEPTLGNPLISVYRRLAAKKRSPDERPLGPGDYEKIHHFFPTVRYQSYQVATLSVFLKMFLLDFNSPNQVSYWREPVLKPETYRAWYRVGGKIDHLLRRVCPPLFRTLSWNNVIIIKPF